jgi:hypothetical protein
MGKVNRLGRELAQKLENPIIFQSQAAGANEWKRLS